LFLIMRPPLGDMVVSGDPSFYAGKLEGHWLSCSAACCGIWLGSFPTTRQVGDESRRFRTFTIITVGEVGREFAVGVGLGEQLLGLLLKGCDGVSAGSKAQRRLVQLG
jgi:hypothetical protein